VRWFTTIREKEGGRKGKNNKRERGREEEKKETCVRARDKARKGKKERERMTRRDSKTNFDEVVFITKKKLPGLLSFEFLVNVEIFLNIEHEYSVRIFAHTHTCETIQKGAEHTSR